VRNRLAICAAVAALSLIAAGCGGSDDDQSNAEAWADDVCSSIADWTETLTAAQATLGDTANLSVNDFQEALDDVAETTETLAAELDDLGVPETEAGAEAEEQLTLLSDELESEVDILRAASDTEAESITDLLTTVSTITRALANMGTAVETTFDRVSNLSIAAELEAAFQSAESCQDLR
jgi:hypothetical protein